MAPSADAVLTKCFLRAAEQLALSDRQVGKQGELALLLIRAWRSLDPLVGRNARQRIAWMRSHNRALAGRPAELVESVQGLVGVVTYLDAVRARTESL